VFLSDSMGTASFVLY